MQPFAKRGVIDDVFADMAASIDVLSRDGTVLRVYYDGRFADDTQI